MKLFVEVADSPETREIGLMERKSLGKNKGMLFKFQHSSHLSFWMKKTYIPLDIAFLDDNGKILQISEMIPLNLKNVRSNVPCRHALEVNRGWFKNNGVSVGSTVDLKFIESSSEDKEDRVKTAQFQNAMEPIDEDELNIAPGQTNQVNAPFVDQEIDMIPEDAFENEFGQFDPMQQEGQEISPNVELLRSYRDIIDYADQNDSTMMISYYSLSGRYWGPRRIGPLENEGYVLKSGPNGEYLTAFDLSPTISGNGWEILGGTPKSFILSNIVDLEIVE